jgi:hypothetical protein
MKFAVLRFLDHLLRLSFAHRLTRKCIVGFQCFCFSHKSNITIVCAKMKYPV